MKNTRKILTLFLTLALFAMCFSLVAYADGAPEEQTEANLAAYEAALALDSKVLEFYEAGTYFELRVEDSKVTFNESEEGKLLKGGAYQETILSDALHFTSVNPTKVSLTQSKPDTFGVNFRAKVTENSPITLYVTSSVTGDYLSIFSAEVGKVSYKFDTETLSYVTEDVNIVADQFFDVAIYVEKLENQDKVSISLKTDGGAAWTNEYTYSNDSTDFLAGKFKYDGTYLSATEAYFGYIEMYPGTFQRTVDNRKNVDVIADGIIKAYEDYTAFKSLPEIEGGAFELAEIVANVVVNHGYSVNDITDSAKKASVKAACDECITAVATAYAAEIEAANTDIITEGFDDKAYNDKLDTVNVILGYEQFMASLESGIFAEVSTVDFTSINECLANAYAELTKLEKIEADSIFVIEELSKIDNIYLATYEELKVAYLAVMTVKICDTYYSELYPAEVVAEAVQKRYMVMTDYPVMDAMALEFVENVVVAADKEVEFATRYAAYVVATENRFSDTTYNKYLTDTTIEQLLEMYDTVDAEMQAVSDYAEAFLSKIREAALTPSYTVKIKALDEAKPYLADVETGYPGVTDAVANYYAMREDIASRKEVAKRYIQAVLNVQLATTVKDKTAAIAIAEGFAALGQELSVEVEGMPITVNEANIILSNEKSAISLKATRIANYVAAAAAAAGKGTLLERRQAINAAIALKANLAEDMEEEDVISATAVLDAAIKAYNDDVKAANSAAEEKDNTALTLLTKTVPSKKIAEVVAIIKKFYEE